jgi:hypothetical protein
MKIDYDKEDGKIIDIEIIVATERDSLEDIFNLSTENLIPEETIREH